MVTDFGLARHTDDARVLIRRAAHGAGCGRCEHVLADGPSIDGALLPWSHVYARCAAESGRDLDAALNELRHGVRYRSTNATWMPDPSAVDVVLAHYWMGRILEKQGIVEKTERERPDSGGWRCLVRSCPAPAADRRTSPES